MGHSNENTKMLFQAVVALWDETGQGGGSPPTYRPLKREMVMSQLKGYHLLHVGC